MVLYAAKAEDILIGKKIILLAKNSWQRIGLEEVDKYSSRFD
jgi:hypothetical protein